jgi:hypothetical protein
LKAENTKAIAMEVKLNNIPKQSVKAKFQECRCSRLKHSATEGTANAKQDNAIDQPIIPTYKSFSLKRNELNLEI